MDFNETDVLLFIAIMAEALSGSDNKNAEAIKPFKELNMKFKKYLGKSFSPKEVSEMAEKISKSTIQYCENDVPLPIINFVRLDKKKSKISLNKDGIRYLELAAENRVNPIINFPE